MPTPEAERFQRSALSAGGQCSLFDQGDYLETLNGLKATSLVTGKATRESSAFSAMNGICFGVNIVLLRLNFNMPEFIAALDDDQTQTQIRGYMGLQKLMGMGTDKLGTRMQPGEGAGIRVPAVATTEKLIKRILGLDDYLIYPAKVSRLRDPISYMVPTMRESENCYMMLTFQGPKGTHSCLAANGSDRVAFFDPNFGAVSFPKTVREPLKFLASFMKWHFDTAYEGAMSKQWGIISVKNKSSLKAPITH